MNSSTGTSCSLRGGWAEKPRALSLSFLKGGEKSSKGIQPPSSLLFACILLLLTCRKDGVAPTASLGMRASEKAKVLEKV